MEVDGYPIRSIRRCVDEQWLDDIAASPERLVRYQLSLPSTDLSWRDQLRRGAIAISDLCFSGALPHGEEDGSYNRDSSPLESSARALELFGKELRALLQLPRAVKHGGRANACIEVFIDRLVEDIVPSRGCVGALPWCADIFVAEMVNRLWPDQEGAVRLQRRLLESRSDRLPRSMGGQSRNLCRQRHKMMRTLAIVNGYSATNLCTANGTDLVYVLRRHAL